MRSPSKSIAALAPLIESFIQDEHPVVVTGEKLQMFVENSSRSDLTAAQRLLALAGSIPSESFKDGWSGLYRIYRAAMSLEPNNPGIATVCFAVGIEQWLSDTESRKLQERIQIAQDLEHLLNELDAGNITGLSYLRGLLFYRHPSRIENEKYYLDQSAKWFYKAIKEASDEEDAILPRLYLGHSLFERNRLAEALEVYEQIDENLLSEAAGDSDHSFYVDRRAECRSSRNST